MLNKKKTNKLTETNQCESCQQFGKGTCNAFKCIARNYCDWEEIMKPKELDWRDKIDWVDDWLEIDCQVIFGEKGKKTLIKFIQYLLTQQRSELKCEDCSPEDKHIIPTDRSTTRISRHCAGEDIQTIAGTLLKSKEWKEWYKYSSENMLFDVDETETVDMMSNEHFNSFIEFTKNKVRSELLEEIDKSCKETPEIIKKWKCSEKDGWYIKNVIDSFKSQLTNLLNKKNE